MANPSSMQFIQAMLNQPGGQFGAGNIPDYGTGMNFGVPMYHQPQMPVRNIRPPVVPAAPGGVSNSGAALPPGVHGARQGDYPGAVVHQGGRQGTEK